MNVACRICNQLKDEQTGYYYPRTKQGVYRDRTCKKCRCVFQKARRQNGQRVIASAALDGKDAAARTK